MFACLAFNYFGNYIHIETHEFLILFIITGSLERMLSNHVQSMFEYLAPRRGVNNHPPGGGGGSSAIPRVVLPALGGESASTIRCRTLRSVLASECGGDLTLGGDAGSVAG